MICPTAPATAAGRSPHCSIASTREPTCPPKTSSTTPPHTCSSTDGCGAEPNRPHPPFNRIQASEHQRSVEGARRELNHRLPILSAMSGTTRRMRRNAPCSARKRPQPTGLGLGDMILKFTRNLRKPPRISSLAPYPCCRAPARELFGAQVSAGCCLR